MNLFSKEQRPKKVAVIIHGLHGGGAERVAANLMNALAKGYDVTAILLEEELPVDYPLSDKVRKALFLKETTPQFSGITWPFRRGKRRMEPYLTKISKMKAIPFFYNFLRELKRARKIFTFRRKQRFDVVLSFLEQGNYYAILSRGYGKTYVSIRNLTSKKIQTGGLPRRFIWFKWLDKFANKVICVSEDVARDLKDPPYWVPSWKTRVIHNWVDAENIRQLGQQPLNDPAFEAYRKAHPFLFITVGRMARQKGHWHLLRAFHKLHEDYPEAGLVIIGMHGAPIDDSDLVADEVLSLGLSDDVLLLDWKKNPHVYMAQSDVFVLPSLYEGFSNILLEAMALGLPILADDCAGVRELVSPSRPAGQRVSKVTFEDYGVVTPLLFDQWKKPDMSASSLRLEEGERFLYEGMKVLLERPELREQYACQSRKRVKDFSPEKILSQWIRLIEGKR